MKNYFGTLNSADDHLLRDAISANNYQSLNRSILVYFPKILGDQHQNFICEIIF